MRVLIIHPTDSHNELLNYRKGLVPAHRLWGYSELENRGHKVELCPPCPAIFELAGRYGWRLWQTIWVLWNRQNIDVVVAIHEVAGLPLMLLKALGFALRPMVVVNMALLHRRQKAGWRRYVWKAALRRTEHIVSLVAAHMRQLERVYDVGRSVLSFTPMPVDSAFFESSAPVGEQRFCLAVGTNDGKDFETLLSALPLGERLVVVTDSYNAGKVRRHGCFGAGIEVYESMQMAELRKLYQRAALIIVPLAETSHGSGHTVFVESQALGKVVIVSGASGMDDYVQDGTNGVRVPVGDVDAMRAAIIEGLNYPERFQEMRRNARECAKGCFSMERYGEHLEMVMKKACDVFVNPVGRRHAAQLQKQRETSDECVS